MQKYKVIPIMISLLLSGFIGMFNETALNVHTGRSYDVMD